ncbi:MAG: hypothetical protein WC707_05620 [Candidatus Babeliaceae bacterium]|jgi:hypothetical protein
MIHTKQTHLACLILALLLHYNTSAMETGITQNDIFPITHLPTDIQNEIASYLFAGKNSRESIPEFEQRCKSLSQEKPSIKDQQTQNNKTAKWLARPCPPGTICKIRKIEVINPNNPSSEIKNEEEIHYFPHNTNGIIVLKNEYTSKNPHEQDKLFFAISPDYSKIVCLTKSVDNFKTVDAVDIFNVGENVKNLGRCHMQQSKSNVIAVNSKGTMYAVIREKKSEEYIDIIVKKQNNIDKSIAKIYRTASFKPQHMYFNKQGTHICLLGSNCTEIETLQVSKAGHIQKDARKSDVSLAEFFHIRGICKNTNYTKIVGGMLKKRKRN